jgi:hypothetical protein
VVRNDVATFTKSVAVSVCRLPFHWTTILTGFSVLRRLSAIANCILVCVGLRAWCSSTRPGPIRCVTLRIRVETLTEVLVQYERERIWSNDSGPSAGSLSDAFASLTRSRFAGCARTFSALTTARRTYESSRFSSNVSGLSAGSLSDAFPSLTRSRFAGSARTFSALTTARRTYESSRFSSNVSGLSAGSLSDAFPSLDCYSPAPLWGDHFLLPANLGARS